MIAGRIGRYRLRSGRSQPIENEMLKQSPPPLTALVHNQEPYTRMNRPKKGKKQPSLAEQGHKIYLGTCRAVGRRDPISKVDVRGGAIHLFGDESSSKEFVTYVLLVVDEDSVYDLETGWGEILRKYGAPARGFHARQLFAKDQRAKSVWKDMTTEQMLNLCLELSDLIAASRALIYLGIVHRDSFPTELPDGFGQSIKLEDKQLFAFGFFAAASQAKYEGILSLPMRKYLWVDQHDKTRVWGIGNIQIKRMMASVGITPEKIGKVKPLMIEAADLISYAAGRAIDSTNSPNKELCRKVMARLNPMISHHWWNPNGTLDQRATERINRCSQALHQHKL